MYLLDAPGQEWERIVFLLDYQTVPHRILMWSAQTRLLVWTYNCVSLSQASCWGQCVLPLWDEAPHPSQGTFYLNNAVGPGAFYIPISIPCHTPSVWIKTKDFKECVIPNIHTLQITCPAAPDMDPTQTCTGFVNCICPELKSKYSRSALVLGLKVLFVWSSQTCHAL